MENKDYLTGRLFHKMKKYDQAIAHYKIAVEDSHLKSISSLAYIYYMEDDYQNKSESFKLWTLGENLGCHLCKGNLGSWYINNKEPKKGIKMLRKGAKLNESNAQFNLGWVYETKLGILCDIKVALKWYKLSAKQGFKKSIAAIERIEKMDEDV